MAVTLRTIADRVGVSVQAVSYVLNGRDIEMRISSNRSQEIRRVAKELNYTPNASARAMQTRKTRQVGVLVRVAREGRIVHPRGLEIIMGINAGLEPSGHIIVVIPVSGNQDTDRVESRVFRERLLDGLILLEDVPEDDERRAVEMIPAAVWVNSNFGAFNCIRPDEVRAGYIVADELHKLGYRKLLLADVAQSRHYSKPDRRRGIENAAAEHGMTLTVEATTLTHDGRAPEWLRSVTPDTAVIANDLSVLRILQGMFCIEGLRPGTDFALACCDDSEEIGWTWPTLSRLKFDRYAMGLRAASMILNRISDPRAKVPSELFPESWIAGSTARAI